MSDWICKGSDGTSIYYEKAPDKDGYVAKKRTNLSGSAGTESYKPADYGDGTFVIIVLKLLVKVYKLIRFRLLPRLRSNK